MSCNTAPLVGPKSLPGITPPRHCTFSPILACTGIAYTAHAEHDTMMWRKACTHRRASTFSWQASRRGTPLDPSLHSLSTTPHQSNSTPSALWITTAEFAQQHTHAWLQDATTVQESPNTLGHTRTGNVQPSDPGVGHCVHNCLHAACTKLRVACTGTPDGSQTKCATQPHIQQLQPPAAPPIISHLRVISTVSNNVRQGSTPTNAFASARVRSQPVDTLPIQQRASTQVRQSSPRKHAAHAVALASNREETSPATM